MIIIDIDKLLEETVDLVGEEYKLGKNKIDIDQLLDS
jgi:hypothetical protein